MSEERWEVWMVVRPAEGADYPRRLSAVMLQVGGPKELQTPLGVYEAAWKYGEFAGGTYVEAHSVCDAINFGVMQHRYLLQRELIKVGEL